MKAFILAGGFGTRLSHIVKDVPKPMAPIAGKPFLEFLIENLKNSNIHDITLLTGYKGESIEKYFRDGKDFGVNIRYSVEKTPLGTGGAIKKAAVDLGIGDDFLVLNGDTYFDADIEELIFFHRRKKSLLTVALKYKNEVKRYGSVKLNGNTAAEFIEKRPDLEDGYINGGIYILCPKALEYFLKEGLLSFENEVIPVILKNTPVFAVPSGGKFIDIGVPEDYYRANKILPEWIKAKKIKTAFLDRDGILIEDTAYPYRKEDLKILPGIIPFLKELQLLGYQFIIVTNQAGIAKGKFTLEQYQNFQARLISELENKGIEILDTFFCPYHPEASLPEYRKESLLRKPNPGMILEAADKHFIDLSKSMMIGDKDSDRIESLPGLKSFILRGNYPIDEGNKSYGDFNEMLADIKNNG